MAPLKESDPATAALHTHRMARLLRHEVGDLLQSVYSTVGILLDRLPSEFELERRLLGEMKSRAEVCKVELDGVVDLVTPLTITTDRTDLLPILQSLLVQARSAFRLSAFISREAGR